MKKIAGSVVLMMLIAFLFIFPTCAESLQTDIDYEAVFKDMEIDELITISEMLSRIINQKRLENATLMIESEANSVAVNKKIKLTLVPDGREITKTDIITYTSANETIASVKDGIVTGVDVGKTEISATVLFEDGAVLEAKTEIEVYMPVAGIKAPQNYGTFVGNKIDLKDIITLSPETATFEHVAFEVNNESIITVDENGILTGLSGGKAIVTIMADGKTAKCNVSVNEPVSSIELDLTELTVGKKNKATLSATVGPETATDKKVNWSSEDESIAKVSNTGVVTGISSGTTTIICTANDGSGIKASAEVTVITAVSSIKFEKKEISIYQSNYQKLTPTVFPEDATDKKIKWESSDTNKVKVNENGLITGISVGTATITATAMDGSGIKGSCVVNVEPSIPFRPETIRWETTWGQKNGRMSIGGINLSKKKTIKAVTCRIECISFYNSQKSESEVTFNFNLAPGASGDGKLSKYAVSGFSTAATVNVKVLSVTYSDGTSYYIPEHLQETVQFGM